jgi:phage terminase large subunit
MTPVNLQECIKTRLVNLKRHNESPQLQAMALAYYANNMTEWVSDWVWTYDPRLPTPNIPMVLFPKQEEYLRWIAERESTQTDGVAYKTRDMGFTWLCSLYLIHSWLFREGFKGAIGSRKENLVDRIGDPDSIFEKLRMILHSLPWWMLPKGFSWKEHDNFCKLINPANGASITGEAGDNIGRGGRNSIYFVDEAAFIEHAQKVDAALSANTNCRIYVSTPNGPGNPFAQKVFSGEVSVFSMGWQDDPRKNHWEIVCNGEVVQSGEGGTQPPESIPEGCELVYPWYVGECKRLRDPVIIAQELDRDFTASLEGVTIPAKWVRAAVDLCKRIRFPESENVVAGLDVADGGANKSVLTIRRGCVVTTISDKSSGGTTDTAYWALNEAEAHGAQLLNYDPVGVGAGVAGTFSTKERETGLACNVNGLNVGETPSDMLWDSGKTSKETFANRKAELWWLVRRRFEKTYEYVNDGVDHPLDELISIPDHPQLIQELSNVLHFTTEAGKVRIEKKEELRRRGVASPDYAESLILCFAEAPNTGLWISII